MAAACVDPSRAICNLWTVSAIDPEVAGQLADELPRDVFVTIVRAFEQDLAGLVRQMVDAARISDSEEYRRAAHGLAGAAGSIGARSLERLARQAMEPGDRTPVQQMIGEIGQEARAALAELSVLASGTIGRP
jgi:HPt (histidine-containing phosphotransfer) domain-containing protein